MSSLEATNTHFLFFISGPVKRGERGKTEFKGGGFILALERITHPLRPELKTTPGLPRYLSRAVSLHGDDDEAWQSAWVPSLPSGGRNGAALQGRDLLRVTYGCA